MEYDWQSLRFQHVPPDKGTIKTGRWPAGGASSDRSFEDDASETYSINVNDVDAMVSTRVSVAHLTTVLAVLFCSLESTIADQRCVMKVVEMVGHRCANGGYRARRNLGRQLGSASTGAATITEASRSQDAITAAISDSRRAYKSKLARRFARSPYARYDEISLPEGSNNNLEFGLTIDEVDRVYNLGRWSRSPGANPNDIKNTIVDAAARCCRDDTDCDNIHSMIRCP